MTNGGSSFKTKPVFTDVNAGAIFSITATLTDLMKLSTRRRRSYIMLPNQLTVNQKDLPPTKKRASRMLGDCITIQKSGKRHNQLLFTREDEADMN